jgi:hypothetical protein
MMEAAPTNNPPCTPEGARQALYSLARKGTVKRTNTGKRAKYDLSVRCKPCVNDV